jgi:anti-anti-sigma factor
MEQLRHSSCRLVVLDLSRVNLLDSVALGGLIYTRKLLEKSGKGFVLRGVQGVVRGLLRDCSLEELLEDQEP